MIGLLERYLVEPGTSPSPDLLSQYVGLTGITPNRMLIGNSLSDFLNPLVTLVAAGSPEFGIAQSNQNESALMRSSYRFDNLNGERYDAPNTTYGDVSGSMSVDLLFRTQAPGFPTTIGGLTGKRDPNSPFVGREILLRTDGSLGFTVDINGAAITVVLDGYNNAPLQFRYADGRWHAVTMQIDFEASEIRVATEAESTAIAAWTPGSLANSVEWRIGGVRAFAAPTEIAYVIESDGDQAVQDDACSRANRLATETNMVITTGYRGG